MQNAGFAATIFVETARRRIRLVARTQPSQGWCTGSIPVCAASGFYTLAEWREQKPALETRLEEARELALQKAWQGGRAAGEKDWRANDEWLRPAFPADYRGSANRIEVSTTAHALSGVVLTEEKLRELQEARRAALESPDIPGES